MSRAPARLGAIIAVASLCAACTTAIVQSVGPTTTGRDLQARPDTRTRIVLDRDSVVEFEHVRVVGDTVYGWPNTASRRTGDSTAIAIRRIRSLEQREVDVRRTVGGVVGGLLGAVLIALIGVLILLQLDHS